MFNIYDSFEFVTAVFNHRRSSTLYKFLQNSDSIRMLTVKESKFKEFARDIQIPLWALKHSLGVSSGEEDFSNIDVQSIEDIFERRRVELNHSMIGTNSIRDLFYRGLKIKVNENEYSHAVGPIHAGIIEPGHFRFCVSGEIIQSLTIRLGFQHRNVLSILKGKTAIEAIPIIESVAADSTLSYSIAANEIFEEASGIEVSDELKLIRLILLEIERVAIHIADLGAMAEDIGYYPLHAVCATDRGIPLGVMETLTGSRFGRYVNFPGEVRLNSNLDLSTLITLAANLIHCFRRVEKEFLRAKRSSTFRERMDGCGKISKTVALQNSFVGLVARSCGLKMDLRLSERLYIDSKYPLNLELDRENLNGDVWSRFYIRYEELKNSILWLEKILPEMNIAPLKKSKSVFQNHTKFKPGIYYKAIEGWRGPVLIIFDINSKGQILDSYIRDPSVLNWHALELAVRGELIGDFPLNNKSFNLSYVGFDL